MVWKEHLKQLELTKKWDSAIEFMQHIIEENPSEMDAFMSMNFLLVNLIIEEDYDKTKEKYYWDLAKQYFRESYSKFSNNAEFLYITGKTAVMGEWLFGIEQEDYEAMIERANQLDPSNYVYKENYYWDLHEKKPNNPELINYCKLVFAKDSPIKAQLEPKGSVGEYILGMKENWCKGVLENAGESAEA